MSPTAIIAFNEELDKIASGLQNYTEDVVNRLPESIAAYVAGIAGAGAYERHVRKSRRMRGLPMKDGLAMVPKMGLAAAASAVLAYQAIKAIRAGDRKKYQRELRRNPAFEKLSAHASGHPRKKRRFDIGSALAGGLGAHGGISIADKYLKPGKMRNPKLVGAAILSGLAAGEGYRSFRSSSRKRELERRGSELQTYLREMKKAKRIARTV